MPTGVMLLMSWLALKVEMSEGSSNMSFLLNKYRIRVVASCSFSPTKTSKNE